MKSFLSLSLTALASAVVSVLPIQSSQANTFSEKPIDSQNVTAVAVPFGGKNHSLTIIEQIPGQKQCWREQGTFPVTINPLLLTFDFTGNCNRATDSNGYSIRLDSQDRNHYLLNIVKRNGELHLIATHQDPKEPELFIGRSYGLHQNNHRESLTKIFLNPGWQITKRVYEGQTLGHFYLSGNSSAISQNSLFESEENTKLSQSFNSSKQQQLVCTQNYNTPELKASLQQLESILTQALTSEGIKLTPQQIESAYQWSSDAVEKFCSDY